jgi:hypothetical protein
MKLDTEPRLGTGASPALVDWARGVAKAGNEVNGFFTSGVLKLANGGTGATTAAAALVSLGGAPLAGPAFTGAPTAPNPTAGTRGTRVATMQMFADEFTSLKSASGWFKLPNGLIVQWMGPLNSNNVGTGWSLTTLPIAFPTATLHVEATPMTNSARAYASGQIAIEGASATGISWLAYNAAGTPYSTANQIQAAILAIGY